MWRRVIVLIVSLVMWAGPTLLHSAQSTKDITASAQMKENTLQTVLGDKLAKQKNENEKRYNQIYSRYSGKINSLEASLRNKDNEIKRERVQKRPDRRRMERLNSERNSIRRELDSTYAQLRRELDRNKLTAYGPRR